MSEAAQRFQYALKKLASCSGTSGKEEAWRDVKVTLLLNLAQCHRKLRVSVAK